MRFISILVFSIFFSSTVLAQRVQVLEQISKEPIAGVFISNKDLSVSVSTDLNGEASLADFSENEILYFQNMLYNLLTISKSKIVADDNIVYLNLKLESLGEVVISASKFEQNKRDIPQKIINISAKDINFNNPQTSADLLESSGNVYIQKSQLGGGSPMIRGFSTNRLLITVDGVRMNNAIFRGGNLQNVISVDPFTVQSTEISLGAGSIVYGSDAIGGVMSFYTKKPMVSAGDSLLIRVGGTTRYASANNEKAFNAQINLGTEHWAFLSSFSFSGFDDLRMGEHGPSEYLRPEYVVRENGEDKIISNNDPRVQTPTGYDQINLMQKIRYEAKPDLSMDLGLFYTTTTDYPRYDRLLRYRGENLRSAEWNYGPQRWFMANYTITKLSSSSNFYDKIQATLAYQNFQESRYDRDFGSSLRNNREEAVDAYSANFDFEKDLSSSIELFYGAEYVFNHVSSYGSEYNIDDQTQSPTVTRYPNGSDWQSIAAYSSIKYKPSTKFVLQSGLRYNHILSHSDFTANNEFLNLPFDEAKINSGALTGTIGISYFASDNLQLKANASSAFRAPNIDDIGKVFDSEPGSVVVPNPNLKPEHAYGGDIGAKLDLNNKLVIDGSVFYTYLDNALIRTDFTLNGESQIEYDGELSNIQAIQNASSANIYGLELGMRYNFNDHLYLSSQYNILKGTEDDNGEEVPVRHIAPDFGNTHLIWKNEKIKLDAFAEYNKELSFNKLAPSEREKDYIYALDNDGNPYAPSWITFNLRSQYNFNNDFSLTLTLENITDQRYKTYSSGIASPGRNLIVALSYTL